MVGFDGVGHDFVESFKNSGKKFLVVDYDPETIKRLKAEGINCLYGDADDNELLEDIGIEDAKMVISTITDSETNYLIVDHIRKTNKDSAVIIKSDDIEEATMLYEKGATYVMMPHYLGGTHTVALVNKHGFDLAQFAKEREKHLGYITHRKSFSVRLAG